MIDIMHLEGKLRTGIKLEIFDRKKAALITPVFRLRFARLSAPWACGKSLVYKYSIKMLFNGTEPDRPAYVDLKNVFGAALLKVAAANSLDLNAKNPFHHGILEYEGMRWDGFEEWTYSVTAFYYPDVNQYYTDPEFRVPCFSEIGQPMSPSVFYDGCYCRAVLEIKKAEKYPELACDLICIQFVAHGDRLGRFSA